MDLEKVPYPTLHGQITYFQEKEELYSSLPINKRDIVLIGDDLFDRGIWNSFYGSERVKNRGIALEGSECTLYRIDKIAKSKPSKIFISTGLFDIKKGRSAQETCEGIMKVVFRAARFSQKSEIFVVGIVPDIAIKNLSEGTNALRDSIIKVNTKLNNYFAEHYIDAPAALCDSTGYLSSEFSYDGVRINGKGYFLIAELLSPHIGLKALNNPSLNDSHPDSYYRDTLKERSAHYKARLSIFNSLQNTSGGVVMLGNSLNNNCWWSELLRKNEVVNRGISGDTVEGMLLRIDDVVQENPRKIYLMAGINDFVNDTSLSAATLWETYQELISAIKTALPSTELYVQSTLPVNPLTPYYEGRNQKVEGLNLFLSSKADSMGYTYLDIASSLKEKNGDLASVYTLDGIHLRPNAYRIWKRIIF